VKKYQAPLRFITAYMTLGAPIVLSRTALAASGNISQVQNFIQSIIEILVGLAGLIATGFFVWGGLTYITSSGNPERITRAKRTLVFSALGLSITIAAFVIGNIVTTLATYAFGS
jgi:TRAP-type C4-dicarboxylate transport system permease small subunit